MDIENQTGDLENPPETNLQDLGQDPDISGDPPEIDTSTPEEPVHWRQKREQLENENRLVREEAERWRQQAELNARSQTQQQAQPAYNPAFDQNLDPEQRITALVEHYNRQTQFGQLASAVHFSSLIDKQEFQRELDKNPGYQKFVPAVERAYQETASALLQAGRPDLIPSRIRLLHEQIGRETDKKVLKQIERTRAAATERISTQQTKPTPVRSTVSRQAPSETPAEAARRRLREAAPDAGY
jgi:hypothetical protein